MPSDHPFQLLFETFGKLPEFHSDKVNGKALETMKSVLDVSIEKSGHFILLKAPRAGHGKTHILTRLQHELGGAYEFVPLHAVGGTRIDAASVLDDLIRRLVRSLPAGDGLTVLDLIARRLFSSSLQPLVNSGDVPCQDRAGALEALRTRPIETFDFHNPGAVTAQWARENFELLGPRLAAELARGRGLSLREVSFWVDALFFFAATPVDSPGRVRALVTGIFDNSDSEAFVHERLAALLGLVTSLMRVVLVADEIEGLASDEAAALQLASFLGTLRQSADSVDVILSINDDIWEGAFLPRLSGGLLDRLTEVVVELEPLDHDGMLALIESRSPGAGEKILSEMDSDAIPTHARGLLKIAGKKWDPALHGNSSELLAIQQPIVPIPLQESNRVTVKAPANYTPAYGAPIPTPVVIPVNARSAPEDIAAFSPPTSSLNKDRSVPEFQDEKTDAAEVRETEPEPLKPTFQQPFESATSAVQAPSAPLNREAAPANEAPAPPPKPAAPQEPAAYNFEEAAPSNPSPAIAAFPPRPTPPPALETPSASPAVASAPTVQLPPKSDAPKSDPLDGRTMRVDNLLRQYRERYGDS